MSQQFIQRIANWLANELITKRLANSSLFINAAHKTHTHVQKAGQKAAELNAMQKVQKVIKDVLAEDTAKQSALGKMYKRN